MNELALQPHHNKSISAGHPGFDIDVFSQADPDRGRLERFIKGGFYQHYQADIAITMPHLLAIQDGGVKAALGIRSGLNPLFIEQYLPCAIENMPCFSAKASKRSEIVEIGSLYSNSQQLTIPLFLVTATTLYLLNKKHMVFCGTSHILNLVSRAGVSTTFLADARQDRLFASEDNWGCYYLTQPKVVSAELDSIMAIIEGNVFYNKQLLRLSEKIARVCQKMEGEF
ncbi:thermostable hemolysin [Thalassotalea mangrovi]|nr:thermostable hemolysin [Thalassotalea mangrovi]